jgi:hypothetical protein
MNLVERAKKILFEPKKEWLVIEQENTSIAQLTTSYLIPLALIPAIASFIGYGLIGIEVPFFGHVGSVSWGIRQAIVSLITTIAGAFITAFIIDALAPNFGATKNLNKAFQLVVFAYTPSMVAGIFLIYPALAILTSLAGIYGLYLLYLGIGPMMKPPQDKITTYFVVSLIVTILVFIVLGLILSSLIIGRVGDFSMIR